MFTFHSTQFNMKGFVMVLSASLLSGLRWTLAQLVTQKNKLGKGRNEKDKMGRGREKGKGEGAGKKNKVGGGLEKKQGGGRGKKQGTGNNKMGDGKSPRGRENSDGLLHQCMKSM